MPDILPRELPAATSVPANAALISDNGVSVEKATPSQIVDADARILKVADGETAPPIADLSHAEGMVLAMVDGTITPIENDPAGAAQSASEAAASALEAAGYRDQAEGYSLAAAGYRDDTIQFRDEAEGFRDEAEVFRDEAEGYRDETEQLRDDTQAIYDLAGQIATAAIYATWPDLDAVTGSPGDSAVIFQDPGTHTDPVTSGTVENEGVYLWSASPAGWERIADTEAVRARDEADRSEDEADRAEGYADDAAEEAAFLRLAIDPNATLPGGEWASFDVDENGNIRGMIRREPGGVTQLVERERWVAPSGGVAREVYTYQTLIPAIEIYVDAAGNIGNIVSREDAGQDPEVTEARGTAATLGDRLDRSTTPGGELKQALQFSERLRRTRARYFGILRYGGSSSYMTLTFMGDSWTDGRYYTTELRTKLLTTISLGGAALTDGGPGFINVAYAHTGFAPTASADPNVVVTTPLTSWVNLFAGAQATGTPQPYPALGAVRSNGDEPIVITGLGTLTGLTLIGEGYDGDGTAQVSWDNSSWSDIDFDIGAGPQNKTVSLTGQGGTLYIRRKSGSNVIIGGAWGRKGSGGLIVNKCAHSGSTSVQWAGVNQTHLAASLSFVGGDMFSEMTGVNDASTSGTTVADVAEAREIIRNTIRTAVPGCDLLMMTEPVCAPPSGGENYLDMHDIAEAMISVCLDGDAVYLDWQPFFGVELSDYSASSPNPFLGSDNRHPSRLTAISGESVMSNELFNLITRGA